MNNSQPHPKTNKDRWPYTLGALASLLWIPQAWLIAWAVAGWLPLINGAIATTEYNAIIRQSVMAGVGVLGLGGLRAALEYWGARAVYGFARERLSTLRQDFAARLSASSPLDAKRPASGQITSAWMDQAEAVVPWLARYQAAQWRVMLVAPVIALVVGVYSWVAALLLLMAAPLIPLFMAIIGWRAQAVAEQHMQVLGHLHGHLLERLRGLPSLRAVHAVDASAARLSTLGRDLAEKTMRVLGIAMLSSAVLELFSALGVALVAVYIGFHLLGELPFGAWGNTLTLQSGLFVLMLAPTFFEPLRELSAVWHDRANGKAAMQALDQVLHGLTPLVDAKANAATGEAVPLIKTKTQTAAETTAAPCIELHAVRIAWNEAQAPTTGAAQHHASDVSPPLQALQVHIPAGAHVAITGHSGSGKSLLLALVAGLIPTESGEIVIGEQTLNADNIASIRQRIGWMGQHPFFFSGSIARNLRMGRTANTEQEQQCLQQAGLTQVIQDLNGEPLGEAGAGISGGEALRLALARLAIQTEANLLLLDEPTAHLDSDTAQAVRNTITHLAQGKTLLVATHDPDLIVAMPYCLELDGTGQIRWQKQPESQSQRPLQQGPAGKPIVTPSPASLPTTGLAHPQQEATP